MQLLIDVQANITSRRIDFFKHFASYFFEISLACSYNIYKTGHVFRLYLLSFN